MFLLVYNSYIEGVMVTFPYTHIMYPSLAHPSIVLPLPCHPSQMILTGFNVSYLYMCINYINYLQRPHHFIGRTSFAQWSYQVFEMHSLGPWFLLLAPGGVRTNILWRPQRISPDDSSPHTCPLILRAKVGTGCFSEFLMTEARW
jgi:hypothetical protein